MVLLEAAGLASTRRQVGAALGHRRCERRSNLHYHNCAGADRFVPRTLLASLLSHKWLSIPKSVCTRGGAVREFAQPQWDRRSRTRGAGKASMIFRRRNARC